MWPLAIMLCADRVPIVNTHSKMRRPKRVLPIPGSTLSALRRYVLANLLKLQVYAAGSNLGSLNGSARAIRAQAMRAILLASATAATLIGRRAMIRASQSRRVPCCRAYRITAMAPATSSHRKYRFPCFEIRPRRSLPPEVAGLDGGPGPFYSRKRTSTVATAMSALGQSRTHGAGLRCQRRLLIFFCRKPHRKPQLNPAELARNLKCIGYVLCTAL